MNLSTLKIQNCTHIIMSAESTHPVVNGNQMYIAERKVCDTRNVKEYCNECATDVMVYDWDSEKWCYSLIPLCVQRLRFRRELLTRVHGSTAGLSEAKVRVIDKSTRKYSGALGGKGKSY